MRKMERVRCADASDTFDFGREKKKQAERKPDSETKARGERDESVICNANCEKDACCAKPSREKTKVCKTTKTKMIIVRFRKDDDDVS